MTLSPKLVIAASSYNVAKLVGWRWNEDSNPVKTVTQKKIRYVTDSFESKMAGPSGRRKHFAFRRNDNMAACDSFPVFHIQESDEMQTLPLKKKISLFMFFFF